MIYTTLPDVEQSAREQYDANTNRIIFAHTSERYFYPKHETPYLFVTNFLNQGNYIFNNRPVKISDRSFYFLNRGDELQINFGERVPLKTMLILFDNAFIKDAFHYLSGQDDQLLNEPQGVKSLTYIPLVPFYMTHKVRNILDSLVTGSAEDGEIEATLLDLVTEFYALSIRTQVELKNIVAVKRSTREELYRRLFYARRYMQDNAFEKITIDQVAREVCLNKFHFLKSFKGLYHITPGQYLTHLKLHHARQLLHKQQGTVSEVCSAVGFDSLGSFSNLFKKRFGITPSALLKP